jgi:phosphoglycolate phosphatase-like HAD superfamily hydrolase
MEKIKGVIFDLDGTIADTLPLCIMAFRQSIEPLINRPITDQEIVATFGPSEEGTIMALAPQQYERGLANYLHYYSLLHHHCPAMFDGIRALLQHLQQQFVRIAMVTGKGHHSTAISLQQFDATVFFEIVETGSAAGPRKAAGIQAVLDAWYPLKKENIIYVGDARGDIEAARNVGIPVIAAAWAGTAMREELAPLHPDQLFDNLPACSAWLQQHI